MTAWRRGVLAGSTALVLAGCSGKADEVVGPGSWRSVASLPGGSLAELSATILPGGDILVAGGSHLAAATWEVRTATYRFEVATETWKPVAPMNEARSWTAAVALASGKVLVSGGLSAQIADQPALASAETFDPASATWSPTGAMHHARVYHSATLLQSGKVLVVGGYPGTYWGTSTVLPLASAELYDPATGEWSETGSLQVARGFHAAALLPSGKVLVVGGNTDGHAATGTTSVEIFDPADGNWHAGVSQQVPTQRPTATRLVSGKVLVTGGCQIDYACGEEMRGAWLYGQDGAWTEARRMDFPRDGHVAVLLSTGKVLLAGGDQGTANGLPASVYDPEANAWMTTGPMQAWHGYSGAGAPLPGGKALFMGGALDFGGGSASNVVEVYEPGRR